jgi:hypothetical protein
MLVRTSREIVSRLTTLRNRLSKGGGKQDSNFSISIPARLQKQGLQN